MNITKNLRLQVVLLIVLLNSTFALAHEEWAPIYAGNIGSFPPPHLNG